MLGASLDTPTLTAGKPCAELTQVPILSAGVEVVTSYQGGWGGGEIICTGIPWHSHRGIHHHCPANMVPSRTFKHALGKVGNRMLAVNIITRLLCRLREDDCQLFWNLIENVFSLWMQIWNRPLIWMCLPPYVLDLWRAWKTLLNMTKKWYMSCVMLTGIISSVNGSC